MWCWDISNQPIYKIGVIFWASIVPSNILQRNLLWVLIDFEPFSWNFKVSNLQTLFYRPEIVIAIYIYIYIYIYI